MRGNVVGGIQPIEQIQIQIQNQFIATLYMTYSKHIQQNISCNNEVLRSDTLIWPSVNSIIFHNNNNMIWQWVRE